MVMSREIKKTSSSIAMLQERFRQLEKVKEMREERELLNLITTSLSSSTSSNIYVNNNNNNNLHPSANNYSSYYYSYYYYYYDHDLQYSASITSNSLYDQLDTSKSVFQSKIIFPNQPSCSWPNSQTLQTKHNASASCCCWDDHPQTKPSMAASPSLAKHIIIGDHQCSHVSSDVDTTLHL